MATDIALLEFHDSVIGAVEVRGRGLRMEIERLYVFREVAPERYDVWTYRAVLIVEEVTEMSIVGSLADGGISDATIERLGARVEFTDLLQSREIDLIELTMQNGGHIRVRGKRARIEVQSPIEKVEQWSGSLIGGSEPSS